ncbi:hypothetical protein BD309DRAFT_250099 [Dichomitus squalens]|nr:hypothetical protein BD309DRAFT_250099 [Dichomitus squalens]
MAPTHARQGGSQPSLNRTTRSPALTVTDTEARLSAGEGELRAYPPGVASERLQTYNKQSKTGSICLMPRLHLGSPSRCSDRTGLRQHNCYTVTPKKAQRSPGLAVRGTNPRDPHGRAREEKCHRAGQRRNSDERPALYGKTICDKAARGRSYVCSVKETGKMRSSNLLHNYNAQLIERCDMTMDMNGMLVIRMRCGA